MQKSLDVLIAEDFNELGLAKIITADYKRYWINKAGQVVSEPKAYVIEIMRSFGSKFNGCKTEGETSELKYALVNNKDQTIVPYGVYDNYEFYLFSTLQGTAFKIEKDGQVGLINYKGELVIPLGTVDSIDQSFLIDLPEGYVLPYEFGQNTFIVTQGNTAKVINEDGKQILPAKEKFNSKKFKTKVDILMRHAIPAPVACISNLIRKKNDDELFGYVNQQNKVIIPYQFYHASEFNNGFAVVCDSKNTVKFKNGKWYRGEELNTFGRKYYHIDETGNRLNYTIKYNENGEIK